MVAENILKIVLIVITNFMVIVIIVIVIIIILMILIRQEPCVYVNGKPYNVRSTDDMANHLVMTEVRLPQPQSWYIDTQSLSGKRHLQPGTEGGEGDQEGGQVHVGSGEICHRHK